MSRKGVLGRTSLSSEIDDGILDIDQVLNATPWNEIDNFVEQNFVQDILDKFQEQMTLDPKRKPPGKLESLHLKCTTFLLAISLRIQFEENQFQKFVGFV